MFKYICFKDSWGGFLKISSVEIVCPHNFVPEIFRDSRCFEQPDWLFISRNIDSKGDTTSYVITIVLLFLSGDWKRFNQLRLQLDNFIYKSEINLNENQRIGNTVTLLEDQLERHKVRQLVICLKGVCCVLR